MFLCLTAGCGALDVVAPPASLYAAAGEPLPGLSAEQQAAFTRGRAQMQARLFPSAGLGPLYSAASCAGCHEKPVFGGSGPRYRNVFVQLPPQSTFRIEFQPQYDTGGSLARTPAGVGTAVRTPPAFFGIGLLAEIPVEEILRRVDPHDQNGDGVRGRVNFERGFVGRFGNKSQMATLQGFVRLSLLDHLGMTTQTFSMEGAGLPEVSPRPVELATADLDGAPDPELPRQALGDLLAFVSLLAPPAPSPLTGEAATGSQLFETAGCTACHVRALRGPRGAVAAYTDLLLHDLGEGLADGVLIGEATGRDHRTPPLWGVAMTGPYLHDGRADTLDAAILAHDGEGRAARDRYAALWGPERAAIIAFLESLGGADHRPDGLLPREPPVPAPGEPGGPETPLAGEALATFRRGRELFDRDFAITSGLGPLFNGDSCRSCHLDPTQGGAGPLDVDVIRQADGAGSPLPGAPVAHRHSVFGIRPAPGAGAQLFERRQTPSTFGLGALDRIDDAALLANADPDDADGDGIRGRAALLPDGRVGRFGWKAQVATLAEFVLDALSNELGLTVPQPLHAASPARVGVPADDDGAADPEISAAEIAALTFYLAALAPPPPGALDAAAQRGQVRFEHLGCARCHVPALPTRDGAVVELYSDLLLHDVAAAEEVRIVDPVAGRAFRTPPLWGLSRTAPYLHDGRAETVDAAIRLHDGEAAAVKLRYEAAPADARIDLLRFLESL